MNREEELAGSVGGGQERRGEAIMERWWNRWEKAKVNEGRRMEGEDSSPLPCRCSWAFSCAAAMLHLNSIFFFSCSIIIIITITTILIIMTTTMLKKYI